MIDFFWNKKPADLKLEAQQAILDAALDDMRLVASAIGEVKAELEAKANGALVKLRAGGPDGNEIKSK